MFPRQRFSAVSRSSCGLCRGLICWLVAFGAGPGCEAKKASEPAPAASVVPVASAVERTPSFEERVKSSTPLAPEPKPAESGGTKVVAQRCKVAGDAFLEASATKVLKAIEVTGDLAYVIDGSGGLRRYRVSAGDECSFAVDEGFGRQGRLEVQRLLDGLSSDDEGRVVASTGVFGNYLLKDGGLAYECKATGLVQLQRKGGWGIAAYSNGPVRKVVYGDGGCEAEAWIIGDLSKPAARRGPFTSISAVGFLDNLVLVGGALADTVQNRQPKVVVAYDEKGQERFRLGNTDTTAREDNFGWIHGIVPCKPGVCVLDSNFRRLTMWKKDGVFVGHVQLGELLGLRYPWVPAASNAKGVLYLVAGQDRAPDSGVAEGLVYRVLME